MQQKFDNNCNTYNMKFLKVIKFLSYVIILILCLNATQVISYNLFEVMTDILILYI